MTNNDMIKNHGENFGEKKNFVQFKIDEGAQKLEDEFRKKKKCC